MAIFSHGNRSINYRIEHSPLAFDLVLLQPSRMGSDFWRPVLHDLHSDGEPSGRVLVCEWFESGIDRETLATDLAGMLRSLGMSSVYLVACEDAVEVVRHMQDIEIIASRLYPQQTPRSDELISAIRDFSQT